MNCSKADDYFMKYMDNCLSEEEAQKLNKHFKSCESCAEDFKIYDSIIAEFSVNQFIEAPADLEERVMAEIEGISPVWEKMNQRQDKVLWIILGAFVVFLSFGLGLFINRDAVLNYMSENPALSGYVEMLAPISNYVSAFITNINQLAVNGVVWITAFVSTYKFIILGAAILLFGIQYIIYKREKVED